MMYITFKLNREKNAGLILSNKRSFNTGNNLYIIDINPQNLSSSTISKNGRYLGQQNDTKRERGNHKSNTFWVSWRNGLVLVGHGEEENAQSLFLKVKDPHPFPVNFMFAYSNKKLKWTFKFPCQEQPTPSPPTTTPSAPIASPPGPVPCVNGTCLEQNTECVDGMCVCKMGFAADCAHCVDINECETDQHSCVHTGQQCVNSEGSYHCVCQAGFDKREDGSCHDINECEDPTSSCAPHAECHNRLGTYECVCCMGYVKYGELCIQDPSQDAVYGEPGKECCACTGELCNDPQPVCGTDGETYANYAAMVVRGCRDNRTIEVSYNGNCENSCAAVTCDRPYETCRQDAPTGGARCSCPDCSGQTADASTMSPVCATNHRIYASKCIFELIMCVAGSKKVTLESSLTPCENITKAGPVGPWTVWGPCDNPCGKGKAKRTRQATGTGSTAGYVLEQETVCYTTCENGPCKNETCHNPGQVCEADAVSGEGVCVCADCTGQPDAPVCALVGDVVRTYENECLMKQTACQLTKSFILLDTKACEDNSPDCSLQRNNAILIDDDGCQSLGDKDIGFCYGKCTEPGACCRPAPHDSTNSTVSVEYVCPNNTTKSVETKVVTACMCLVEPQH